MSLLRIVAVGGLLLVALVLQTTVLPLLLSGGFRPDLVLLVVVAVALADGAETGTRIGFGAGLLVDLLLATPAVGVAALAYALVGFGVGTVRPLLAATSATAPPLLGLVGGGLGTLGLSTLASLLGDAGPGAPQTLRASAAVALTTAVLIHPVLGLTRRLSARVPADGTAPVH